MNLNNIFVKILLIISIISCSQSKQEKLPYIGVPIIIDYDTVQHRIPQFDLINQDSVIITNSSFSDYIYISDFFYSYCPSVCPQVKNQMLRIYDRYEDDERVKLVSFALDPSRDDVENLHRYAKNLGVESSKWYYLTGDKDEIWALAESFLISVVEDPNEPGGIYHSGKIILIDNDGHIRGFANGTEEEDVTGFIHDIDILLKEIK